MFRAVDEADRKPVGGDITPVEALPVTSRSNGVTGAAVEPKRKASAIDGNGDEAFKPGTRAVATDDDDDDDRAAADAEVKRRRVPRTITATDDDFEVGALLDDDDLVLLNGGSTKSLTTPSVRDSISVTKSDANAKMTSPRKTGDQLRGAFSGNSVTATKRYGPPLVLDETVSPPIVVSELCAHTSDERTWKSRARAFFQ
jgi:hypothetical protein